MLRSVPRVFFQRRFYAQDFHIKKVMRLPKQQMYDVVSDVEKYQEFVPYCLESTISKTNSATKRSDENTEDSSPTYAILRVGWNQLDERFESKVTYTDDRVLAVATDNEMFKELESEWTIKELDAKQCSVALRLRFQFQNSLYNIMAQGAGGLVAKRMVEAFTKRAVDQYKNANKKTNLL